MARDWEAEGAGIADELLREGLARWPGVGEFRVVEQAARHGRNPVTGEAITIEGRRLVQFSSDDAFLDSMGAETTRQVLGFGVFEVKVYPGYEGRNPRTGQIVQVPEKRGGLFQAAPELLARLKPFAAGSSDAQ